MPQRDPTRIRVDGHDQPNTKLSAERQNELDRLTDRQFLYETQRMALQEKEALFSYERERLRSFKALWPMEGYINGADIAREGFFYTGNADRVQCAFCRGILRNWERGDDPHALHRRTFPYCKFAQGRECGNVALSIGPYGGEGITTVNTSDLTSDGHKRAGLLGITDAERPDSSKHSVASLRSASFLGFPANANVKPKELVEAGFYYTGSDDKVQCFQCGGVLGSWNPGEKAWEEHAKWFPGCSHLIRTKGHDFIRKCRVQLTEEEKKIADEVEYKFASIEFLETPSVGTDVPLHNRPFVYYCKSMGHSDESIKAALKVNGGDFNTASDMLKILYAVEDGTVKEPPADDPMSPVSNNEEFGEMEQDSVKVSVMRIEDLITSQKELTEEESRQLLTSNLCQVCHVNPKGAVVLPCSCFALCQSCSVLPKLPKVCPKCQRQVKGSVRVYLS